MGYLAAAASFSSAGLLNPITIVLPSMVTGTPSCPETAWSSSTSFRSFDTSTSWKATPFEVRNFFVSLHHGHVGVVYSFTGMGHRTVNFVGNPDAHGAHARMSCVISR